MWQEYGMSVERMWRECGMKELSNSCNQNIPCAFRNKSRIKQETRRFISYIYMIKTNDLYKFQDIQRLNLLHKRAKKNNFNIC